MIKLALRQSEISRKQNVSSKEFVEKLRKFDDIIKIKLYPVYIEKHEPRSSALNEVKGVYIE